MRSLSTLCLVIVSLLIGASADRNRCAAPKADAGVVHTQVSADPGLVDVQPTAKPRACLGGMVLELQATTLQRSTLCGEALAFGGSPLDAERP